MAKGLVGIVKNELDGSVYIEAQGKEEDLQSFVQWLYKGSPLSNVREVKWEEEMVSSLCRSFWDKMIELHQVDYKANGLEDLGKGDDRV